MLPTTVCPAVVAWAVVRVLVAALHPVMTSRIDTTTTRNESRATNLNEGWDIFYLPIHFQEAALLLKFYYTTAVKRKNLDRDTDSLRGGPTTNARRGCRVIIPPRQSPSLLERRKGC